jgi:1-pyrroline-5-carboxylate dehydrogenase
MEPFKNEPYLDFSRPEESRRIGQALEDVLAASPRERPLVLNGERVATGRWIESRDPGDPRRLLGRAACAGAEEAERALSAALEAFASWSRTPAGERAAVLHRTAAILRRRRLELDALVMLESGKVRAEADADVAEAIDFLEFYAREMLRYAEGHPLVRVAGEDNRLVYLPLGVAAVIAPWNFPIAILTGMTSAAIVTGNCVVLKPSNETPLIAYEVVEAFEQAGLPPGVLNLLPGRGSEIGELLVKHPRIRLVAFTGSKEVGLRINELAAATPPGQIWIKRVIAEMGGKDAIVVDSGVDLDSAAEGIVASAFGYQGQKCSACSRVIAVEGVYQELVERVAKRAGELRLGRVEDSRTEVGPVISESALKNVSRYIELGKGEGKLVAGGGRARVAGAEDGYFLEPTVFAGVDGKARIAQEEIFGPVLAMIPARDFDEALRIANGTQFGLTGAVYSRNHQHLEKARAEFHVGNLYLNRKCTGALVGVHPFGGFNMSGTDSKAGGRDYLLLFLQAKVVAERIAGSSAPAAGRPVKAVHGRGEKR